MEVNLLLSILILYFAIQVNSKSDIRIGYRVTLAIPIEFSVGFIGRAFLMQTNQIEPNFKVGLSIEPINGKYSCSLQVFLGDVKVWNSGHYSPFLTSDKCVLELTEDGDLQLKGQKEVVGWRTGTHGQGVERLQILGTGNLILVDGFNRIKWQSFNFPTDVMLWGQRLNVATRLTSFPINSTALYSFQIQHNKIALYTVFGKFNYSYWEFKPSKNRNITFVELGSHGLELFNDKHHKIAQILSPKRLFNIQPRLRFLALSNRTGNLGLYFYSEEKQKFEAAFQALNTTCDLPLACKPYGICTFSSSCSCIRLLTKENDVESDCDEGFSGGFCDRGKEEVEMLELNGASSVLKENVPVKVNISKEECANICLQDCKCVAALYSFGECFVYGVVMGIKQVETEKELVYMLKVPKGDHVGSHGKSGLKKWVLVLVGAIDGLVILVVLGGLGYYFIQKRRTDISSISNNNN